MYVCNAKCIKGTFIFRNLSEIVDKGVIFMCHSLIAVTIEENKHWHPKIQNYI